MRLHRLSVTAFGPFRGTQHVDFDALTAAGVFLLHGATGAGKTSVLDAVCFALYGGVPGARQQPGGTLRSHHADPHTLTEVVLELTVAGRRLELTRRPDQLRPKRTGTGLTRERAHAELREYDTTGRAWRGLSRSHQEIGEEIGGLLGMSREQFCQVVLLPQGDFSRFLRAGAEERAKLLGRLFDTGRFAAVEEQLARMRRDAQEAVRSGDDALHGLAHRIRQAAGPQSGDAPAPGAPADGRTRAVPDQRGGSPSADGPGPPESVLTRAALARAAARERYDIAALACRTAEQRHARALRHLEDARETERLQQRFADARRRADALAAEAGRRRETARRLERARAAHAVAPVLALRDAAAAEHDRHAAAEAERRAALPEEESGLVPAELTALEHRTRQELGGLEAARRAERRGAEIDGELAALDRDAGAEEEAQEETAAWLSGWEETHHAHRRRVEEAQEAATRAEQLAARLDPVRRRLAAARRRDTLADEAAGAAEEALRAREQAAAARDHWLELKDRRLRGIAAELAAGLRDGAPCAVCGATEHPAPARPDAGHVDRRTEEAALERHRAAEAGREEAGRRRDSLREQLTAARAESGEDGVPELAESVRELEAAHAAARSAAAGGHAAREALDHAEREHARRLAAQREAERRAAARASRREALQRERTALAAELAR
ncbi:AAA family ATPase, partial [Streptomyces sp. JJ36]|uniref:AAA family ATPase n=1 Tax=Streptomyces sp. JJ36 TaxID=2736645 RepID=UPI001F15BD0D